jgi:hypothetical protein
MITDDSGDAQSGYFKHVYVDGTIQGSNLKILGDFVTLDTITSNTEQMVITNAGTGPALKVTQTGANSIAEFYDDGNVLALKIADGGNVGIGTGIPMGKLHVNGNVNAGTILVIDGTALAPSLSFSTDTDVGLYRPGVNNTLGMVTGGVERVRISADGNVGIGTGNPLATLAVVGNGQASFSSFNTSTLGATLQISDSTSVVNSGGAVVFGTYQGNFAAIKSSIENGNNNTVGHLSFHTRNAVTDSSLTNRMTILNNGSVGIGITNPLAKLHVNGNFYAPGSIVQFQGKNVNSSAGTSSTSYVASGISIDITPKFATSKLFFHFAGTGYTPDANNGIGIAIYRKIGASTMTMVYGGSVFGLAGAHNMQGYVNASGNHSRYVVSFIDTPNTSVVVTYEVYIRAYQALAAYLGNGGNTPCDIHVFEIAV